MDAELKAGIERLDRRFDKLIAFLEGMELRNLQRFERSEARMEQLENRISEQITGVNERLSSMALRIEQFEGRVVGKLAGLDEVRQEIIGVRQEIAGVRQEVLQVRNRLDHLSERVDHLEDALLKLGVRLDSLSDDMRQRFRVVNDRLAQLAA
jgi:chromosome segregation ATPase